MKRSLLRWGAVAVAAFALGACGSDAKESSSTTTAPMGGLGGLVPTTALGGAVAPTRPGKGPNDVPDCTLLSPADVDTRLTMQSARAFHDGEAPKQFASGGSGWISNCSYGEPGRTRLAVSVITADKEADARADYLSAAGAGAGNVSITKNTGRLLRGKKQVILTINSNFKTDPPAGVDPNNPQALDAYYDRVLRSLFEVVQLRI
jgi:hypothetical protein